MSRRSPTLIAALTATAAAAAALLGAGAYWILRRPLARTRGSLSLPGLVADVEVLRDRWGVPHLYAGTASDLMLAQGFVHAQDRLWQMEFQRRLVAGRLSEVLGADALPVDRWMRTLTMRRVAEQEVDLLEGETRALLEAYAAGVNARIDQGRLPLEFTLLRYRPEPWAVADTLSWIKMMSWSLSVNWEAEILRARLIERLGPERAAELEPDYAPGLPIILEPGVDYALAAAQGQEALARAEAARPFSGPRPADGLGSNNWVVAASRTAGGAPLLANDMHLQMGLPCIWYENHLVADGWNVTGVTFPGIPGVVAGHNGGVAWGFTNGFPDVQDLYIERLRRVDGGPQGTGVQYEFRGEWHDAQVHREEITVKGGGTVVEEVVVTCHGPIISSLAPELAAGQALALRWTSLEPDTMICGLVDMARARNCLEFREALRHWTAPVQNMVYADTEGNIAYSFPGKVPIRARGDGRVPVPGWAGEHEWTGYVPFEELPHLYNPPQGYVATANNRVAGEDYPHELGVDHCAGYRAQRIVEWLQANERVDLPYLQRMQFDQVSAHARAVARHLVALQADDPEVEAALASLRGWEGELAAGSAPAAVYEVLVRKLFGLLLSGKLGDLAAHYAGKGPTPVLAESSILGHRAWEWLERVLAEPDSPWFDLGAGETRDDVLRLALRETVAFLQAELGPRAEDWAWGKLHTLTYRHLLGRVKPLDRLFSRGPYPLGGDSHTLWATGSSEYDLNNDSVVGPPFRFLADLGDLDHCRGLLAPGQSGQPGSPHYDDQIQAWFEGGYHPMLYAQEEVERGAQARLVLRPCLK
jgi:penicillin G amidase